MHTFETSLKAKLIYVFAIPDEPHAGCLKVGDATFYSDKGDAEDWPLPNSELLDASINHNKEKINFVQNQMGELLSAWKSAETATASSAPQEARAALNIQG